MRNIEIEIEIAADAAEVWRALSTSEGIASWFAANTTVEPGAGGRVTVKWGEGMEGSQRIEIWEPERQLRVVQDRPEPAPPGVVDYFIEGRGGTTVLRLVHSGFEDSANFDDEYNSTRTAWPVFMQMLKHSTERGIASCRNVTLLRMLSEPKEAAWAKLIERLGGAADGIVRHFDPKGCVLCYEFPAKRDAMLGVFCEKCSGVTALTVMWLLYDASAAEAEATREEWGAILTGAFGQPAAA